MVKQIQVEELKALMDQNPNLVLIDVRESDEHHFCSMPHAKLIPLSKFADSALKELNPNDEIYVHCHHGGRSQRACEFLEQNGFGKTHNVTGGIDAWSLKIDSKVPRY